ncbi:HDOD domain-containing protein [Methylomonas albis]|nr:HDOD domain-containing protein [Methylomonas albis]
MVEALTEETTLSILKGLKIPPQPQIMVDLQLESAMPGVSLDQIADIISRDIGISGAALKVINSPFFGLRGKVTSIKHALNLLGLQNTLNIVNGLALRNTFSYQSLVEMTEVWDNSFDVAMACAAIAKITGIASVDEAYTFGLFHDSGIALLMEKFENYTQVLKAGYSETKRNVTDIENASFETNHSVVGYYVAKAWHLPEYLCQGIADHHKTEAIFSEQFAFNPKSKNLLALLKLAENTCLSNKHLGHAAEHYEFHRIKDDLLIYLGLSDYDLDDIQASVRDMQIH